MSRISNYLASFRAGINMLRAVPEPDESINAADKPSEDHHKDDDGSVAPANRPRGRNEGTMDQKPSKIRQNKRSDSATFGVDVRGRKKSKREEPKKSETVASGSGEAVASGSAGPSAPRKRKGTTSQKSNRHGTREDRKARRIKRKKYEDLNKQFSELAVFDSGDNGSTQTRSIVGSRSMDAGIAVTRSNARGCRQLLLYSYLRDTDLSGMGYPDSFIAKYNNIVFRTNLDLNPVDGTIKALSSEREFIQASRVRVLPVFNSMNSCVARCYSRLNRGVVQDMFGLVDRPRSVSLVSHRRDGMSVAIIEYESPEAVFRTLSLQRNARNNLHQVFLDRYEDEDHWPLDLDTDSD